MKTIKVLLLYPPEQSWPGTMVKPNGSLAYPYLGAALQDIGVETYVYDAFDVFFRFCPSQIKRCTIKSSFRTKETSGPQHAAHLTTKSESEQNDLSNSRPRIQTRRCPAVRGAASHPARRA